jgi:hypothetical protein
VVQVPPLHLTGLQPPSPPTIPLTIPTDSSHSNDEDKRIEAEGVFQESINEKVAVISGTHKSLTTSVNNCSKTLSTFKEVHPVEEAEVKKRMDDL